MDTPIPASLLNFDIDLIVYDFDGVMTNNRVYVFEDGREAVQVNRADGLGVNMIRSIGIPQIILSTETNLVVAARATKLGVECLQGIDAKDEALEQYCAKHGYQLEGVLYVGNDLNDLAAMQIVGFPVVDYLVSSQFLGLFEFLCRNIVAGEHDLLPREAHCFREFQFRHGGTVCAKTLLK